jgi:hypothetical protein
MINIISFLFKRKEKESMNDVLKKLSTENEDQYIWRIGQAKDSGLINSTWQELTPRLNMELGIDETEWRGESAWRKKYRVMQQAYDNVFSKQKFNESYCDDIDVKKRELEKERAKLRTEKLEYNRWLRENARDELIAEKIADAIRELPPLKIPNIICPGYYTREGVLLLADHHYGAEFKITGLFGETLNEYSPEIFEARMWDLLNQVIDICKKEGFTLLHVYDLGDEIDGLLRVSQLWKLRYGVIESAVRYSNFISEWLNELSNHVYVKYQMVKDSNHCQLRLLGQPKNTFKDENVSYIITDKLMDRLSENPNFEFEQNPTGFVYDCNVAGYSILGVHGECKNLDQAIQEFTRTYSTYIDFLVGGHKHHQNSKNVGIQSDVISAPSIIGVDDYALSLNKTSDPGATLFILENGKGKVVEYNIKL